MKKQYKLEIRRQSIHAFGGIVAPIAFFVGLEMSRYLLGLVFFIIVIIAYFRVNRLVKNDVGKFVSKEIEQFERPGERPVFGAMVFFLGLFVVSMFVSLSTLMACALVLAFGDSVSTLIGKIFGKHKLPINKNKTLEGSASFFVAASFVLMFFVSPMKALMFGLIMSFVEAMPFEDNLSVPIILGFLMEILG